MDKMMTFRRGTPIVVDLVVQDAGSYDPASLSVTMDLKPARGSGVPPASVAKVASFAVVHVPAAGAEPAYWRGTIAAAVSETLPEDNYVTDALIKLAGVVIDVTDDVAIRLTGKVTAP